VFPHAPLRPVTINGGVPMRAWYDILSMDAEGRADESGLRESSAMLEKLIDREIERGMTADKIVIAGFSQGGAVAIHTALHTSHKLGGLLALSTYMALLESSKEKRNAADLPVFMAHGTLDPVLPMAWGRVAAEKLIELGFSVDWHEYAMQHAVCPQEIAAIGAWLRSVYAEAS
jgi:phospholipase/carboxylesterase